jgi:NADPH-dependent 2,4-dienoyl-CoA reductase/sulfur reductase-like enzyme
LNRQADYELVVVGGGLASARAIRAYRESGGGGPLALVSRDRHVPYHRPPLSKRYLRGEQEAPEDAYVEPHGFYGEQEVELLLEREAVGVDPEARRVELDGDESLGYAKLLLATGADPRRLPVPGADLGGVFTLRTLDDATAIRESAREARRAVVLGSSFIGMEVAASLTQLGVAVTLVALEPNLFDTLRVEELSDFLAGLYRDRGVELVLEDSVTELAGDGRLERVQTRGGRTLPADLVVQGVGVVPATGFLEGSGIEVENGVVVDERFAASVPGVWAAGDMASFYDPVLGVRRRIEHWSNASYQGAEVGKLLAGEDARYDTVSAFFSEVFGFTLRVLGEVSGDAEVRGSFAEGDAVALYREGGRLRGALAVGQDDEELERLENAIRSASVPD